MSKRKDLTGQKFRTRIVLGRSPDSRPNNPRWQIRCLLCGYEGSVTEPVLLRGNACGKCAGTHAQWAIHERLRGQGFTEEEIERLRIGAPVTVGQLIRKTEERMDSPVFVYLVGPKGRAVVRIKEVLIEEHKVMLLADLPEVIEPWLKER